MIGKYFLMLRMSRRTWSDGPEAPATDAAGADAEGVVWAADGAPLATVVIDSPFIPSMSADHPADGVLGCNLVGLATFTAFRGLQEAA
jgi:hypothetical protein